MFVCVAASSVVENVLCWRIIYSSSSSSSSKQLFTVGGDSTTLCTWQTILDVFWCHWVRHYSVCLRDRKNLPAPSLSCWRQEMHKSYSIDDVSYQVTRFRCLRHVCRVLSLRRDFVSLCDTRNVSSLHESSVVCYHCTAIACWLRRNSPTPRWPISS